MIIIDKKMAQEIWSILIEEVDVNPDQPARSGFVHWAMEGNGTEYRICGKLGVGGKFWNNMDTLYVSCYREQENPERLEIIRRTSERLADLVTRTKNVK